MTAAFTPTDSVDYQSADLDQDDRCQAVHDEDDTELHHARHLRLGDQRGVSGFGEFPLRGDPPGTVGVYNGTVLLCTATLNSTGNGSCNLSSNSALAVGSHSIAAKYSATTNFAASTSAAQTLTVKH